MTAPLRLKDGFSRLYRPQRLLGRSPRTVHQHEVALRHFRRFLGREPHVRDLTDETVTAFADWFAHEQPRSPVTVNKTVSRIVAQWRFFSLKQISRGVPQVPKLPEPNAVPEAWTAEELRALLAACAARPGAICGVPAGQWWTALHYVLLDTGERVGAILQLRWPDVDLPRALIMLRAKTRKGGVRPLVAAIADDTVDALRTIKGRRELVFPWGGVTREHIYWHYAQILRAAGLPTDRRSKFHRLRRSTASHLDAAGFDATRALGHSSAALTRARYLDPRITGVVRPCEVTRRLRGTPGEKSYTRRVNDYSAASPASTRRRAQALRPSPAARAAASSLVASAGASKTSTRQARTPGEPASGRRPGAALAPP